MFGHDWQKATGTVVSGRPIADKVTTSGPWEFVVDVALPGAEVFRALVLSPKLAGDFRTPDNGATVGVEVEAKTRKVRFDQSDPQLSAKAFRRSEADRFEQTLQRPPGSTDRAEQAPHFQLSPETAAVIEELRRKLEARTVLPPIPPSADS